MSRRSSGFLNSLVKTQRELENEAKARRRKQEKYAKELERTRLAEKRAKEQLAKQRDKNAKDFQKEQARLYTESRIAEVDRKNAEVEDTVEQLENILQATLSVDDYFDLETLKETPILQPFIPPTHLNQSIARPKMSDYLVPEPGILQRLMPGAKRKYHEEVERANATYKADLDKYQARIKKNQEELANILLLMQALEIIIKQKANEHNAEIDQFKQDLQMGKPEAVMNYFTLVLETSIYPDRFPQYAKIAYVPESKQLVVEYDLPTLSIVPEVNAYKYAKTKDEITTTSRPMAQRKALYSSIVAQVTIRTIHELFEADRLQHLETIVFNGYVETVDKGTGRDIRTCLVTVRTSRDQFLQLDLNRIDPEACLKTLNAGVSKSPSELVPVRPVLEFSMVDPRFVEETDVLSTLDQRPNLMELSPTEFESLITNLFQKMGLEARQTQASRDGGVDCVAYDPRPIFGGKVIIQAKRYKHTVGVSAVRDLFGTLQNEGASKGILVTTSGYGKAAFEFADGKPLELLSGMHLLHLLKEHADIDAKIEIPTTWKDPILDVEEA